MAKKSVVFTRMSRTVGRRDAKQGMKSASIISVILAFFVASLSFYGEANDGKNSQVVTLRLLPLRGEGIRKQLWETLVKIAEPVTLEVPAKVSTWNAVRTRCGSVNPELIGILAKLNPGLKEISDKARELTFIPCPYWAFPLSSAQTMNIPIRKGESISNVLPLYMGTAGDKTCAQVKGENPKILDDKGIARYDGVIGVHYITKPVTFRLREGIKQNAAQIVRELRANFPDTMTTLALFNGNTLSAGNSYRLVAQEGPQVGDTESDCSGPTGDEEWPFNQLLIETVYEDTLQQLKGAAETRCVLVADTGLDLSNPTCNRIIWTNPRFPKGLGSPYGDGPHGKNVTANNGNIEPTSEYEFAAHGTQVVSIISGNLSAPSKLLDRFKVAVAKITPDRAPFNVPAAAVSDAFRYARQINASVLNLSVLIGSPVDSLVEGLRAADFLVVVAAGNNWGPLEQAKVYPPSLNKYRDNLIVVGAHDWKNCKADFSNYSGKLVDLLAPGCAVPIPGKDGKTLSLTGTSFATPFVAFTAALLSSFGLTPGEIKNRILATVDFDEQLVNVTRSAGRLNIENALSINDDILVLKDKDAPGKVIQLRGELDPHQYWICQCSICTFLERPYFPQEVGRVVPNYTNHGSSKVWERPDLGELLEMECDSLEGEVKFRQKGADSSSPFTSYKWSDVITVMPKIPRR